MQMLLLLLALGLQAKDVVTTREGRRLEGRVVEYERMIEVEGDEGRRTRLYRHEVARIDPGADFPRCPEVFPFPPDLLEKTEYDYASYRRILVALPKRLGEKIVAVDVAAAKRLWELAVPDALIPPVVAGSALYVVEHRKALDESRKLKFGGTAMAKEVHTISVKAVDLETCETRWSHTFDNNDRRDLFWTVAANPAPTLHFLPDRVALRISKDAWPVDRSGNCDKTRPLKFATFVSVDPDQKRVIGAVDSDDAAEAGGRPWFTPDLIVLQAFINAGAWKLVGVGARDGKKRWETDPVTGSLHAVSDDWAYASDLTHFHAISLKTGKRHEKWAHELLGGRVAEVEGGFAFVYRGRKEPRQIEILDLKKGSLAFKIPMPKDDEYAHLRVIGPRLLCTDRLNRIQAFDLTTRKEAWTWTGTGPTFVQSPVLLGGALAFYKDARITLLNPADGQKLWDVKGSYRYVVPVGDEGFLAVRTNGADLVRRRRFDRPGVFFTPTDTPLRYAWGGDETWSPPAVADGVLYTLSSGAAAVAVRLADRTVVWGERLSRTPVKPLSPPVVLDGALFVNLGAETQVWALSNKGRLYQARHTPLGPERQFETSDGLWFACASGVPISGYEIAGGKRVWDSEARGIVHYAVAGDTIHAISLTRYYRLDLRTGKVRESSPLPRGTTAVAADGRRTVLLSGPYGLGAPGPDGVRTVWKARSEDPRIGRSFGGQVALVPDGVLYAHADGALSFIRDGAEQESWSVPTPEFTSPILVHEGRAWFAAAAVGLRGVDLQDGRVVWSGTAQDAALFTPVLWEGKPAFWSAEGWLIPVRD